MYKIPGFEDFKYYSHIKKGWSDDEKYLAESSDGRKLLVKISDIKDFDKKKAEFAAVERISQLGIPMMIPIKFGTLLSENLVYMVFSWIEGDEAENIMPSLSVSEQKQLGYDSGVILKKIHSVNAPAEQMDWAKRFNSKIDRNISKFKSCGFKIPMEDRIIKYINDNRKLLDGRPQTIQHGDYHVGNIFITPGKKLSIIDFNRWDYGDPWEEFNRIVWTVKSSEVFASAQLDGYFMGRIPDDFFKLMALYIAANSLAAIPWAIPFGDKEVEIMLVLIKEMLDYYDNFNTYIPKWYKEY